MPTARASDLRPVVSLLEKTPFVYETLLRNLPADLLQWKPAADRWSISEVLAHVADAEKMYSERIGRVLAENSPSLRKYEPPDASRPDSYLQGSAGEHLMCFTALRRDNVAALQAAAPSAGERTAVHSELGPVTLSQMLNELASHDLGHLRQIAELYRAHEFYPYAGPFQKYSNPKP